MDDVFSVSSGADMLNVVQIALLSTYAAFLSGQTGIDVILCVVYKIQQREATGQIPVDDEMYKESLKRAHKAHRSIAQREHLVSSGLHIFNQELQLEVFFGRVESNSSVVCNLSNELVTCSSLLVRQWPRVYQLDIAF